MADMKVIIGADISNLQSELSKAGGATQAFASKAAAANAQVGNSFQRLASSSSIATSAISNLGSTLLSGALTAGIGIAITGLVLLGKEMFSLTKEQQRLTDVLEGAKSAYVKATLEVDKMRDTFDKAKKGVISKEKALQIYNSTIGLTIGQTNNLDTAEKNFIANADNYIKFTLLKAAANIALGKAAEAAFKAEQERIQGPRKATLLESLGRGRFGQASDKQLQEVRIGKALKEQASFQSIYNSLLEQANALGFKGIEQDEKKVKVIEKQVKKKKELIDIDFKSVYTPKVGTPDRKETAEPTIVIKPKFEIEISDADNQKNLRRMFSMFSKAELEKFGDEVTAAVNKTIENIANDSISQASESIGQALAGNKEALPNLFGNLKKGIGGQLKELGREMVKLGLEMLVLNKAIDSLRTKPGLAIAAGIALEILGSALVESANKKANAVGQGFASGVRSFSGGSALVGERGPERIFLPAGSSVQPNNELNAFGGGGVTLMPSIYYEGTGFRVMLNRVDAQMSRNS